MAMKKKSAEEKRASRRRSKLKEWCQKYSSEVIEALLETPHWPKELEAGKNYTRWADGGKGSLSVFVANNGDLMIEITAEDGESLSLRFDSFFGSGKSLRTRAACVILALAMLLDGKNKHPKTV